MSRYYPGEQKEIYFTVPDTNGDNTSGLLWSVKLFVKDGAAVGSGTEYTSISCVAVGSAFYRIRFTPDVDSTSVYTLSFLSDAGTPDYFEEIFEVDWEKLYLEADMDHDTATPESVTYKLPGGATLSVFNLTRVGTVLSREKQ